MISFNNYKPVVIVIVCLCAHRSPISGLNKMKESMYEPRETFSKRLRKKTHWTNPGEY